MNDNAKSKKQLIDELTMYRNKVAEHDLTAMLRESETRFCSIINSSPMGIHTYSIKDDGRLVFTGGNPAADAILGVDNAQFIGKTIEEAFPPLAETEVPQRYREAALNGKAWTTEQITYKDNKIKGAFEVHAFQTSPGNMAAMFLEITERKRAEEALRDSEEKYRAILQTVAVGILIHDNGLILNCNSKACALLGYSHNELVGSNLLETLFTPECQMVINEKIQSEDVCPYEVIAVRKDGTRFTVEIRSSELRYEGRDARIATFVDISERKNDEELLKIQRDISIACSESGDLNQQLCKVLDSCMKMEGIDAGGIYLRDVSNGTLDLAVHRGLPESFIAVKSHFDGGAPQARFVAQGKPIHDQYQKLPLPHDNHYPEEPLRAISIVPIKNQKDVIGSINLASYTHDKFSRATYDAIESIAGVMGEFISRMQAETRLRESEERYRLIIDRATDVIAKMSPDGKVTFVTPSVEKLSGYSVDEFLNRGFSFIIDEESRKEADSVIGQIIESGDDTVHILEQVYICKDGSSKTCEVKVSLVPDSDGRPAELICIIRDISTRKEMEEKLRQSEKMEAIGQLAGGVAHDFNNQLAAVVGYADLIREEVRDNEELSRYADNILIGSRRAAELTAQLLAFARKGKYLSVTVDVHKIIFEVVSLLQRSIDKKIKIRQQLHANPSLTTGDPTQLQNALLNLALNARDAMPSGGDILFATDIVELKKDFCEKNHFDVEPGFFIKVGVTDTGTGIDPVNMKRIFEPFFTTKEQGRGTGMGLAAVYGTVKTHKGVITVDSEKNHGTTFHLYLPVEAGNIDTVDEVITATSAVRGSARVLLVDDEDLVCEMTHVMLHNLGYTVTICHNGREAVDYYRDHWREIDIVILDIIMPEMGGRDAFIKMKEINPDVIVLLSSGYSIDSEAKDIMKEGAQGFIQKPFRKNNLSQKIAGMLSG